MEIYAFADEASPFIDGQIAAMKRNGLSGLEIRNVDNINVSDITSDKAREIRKKMDDAGLCVWSIGSPLGKIDINDDFNAHLDKLKHTLEIADILGSKNIRMFSFYIDAGKKPSDYRNEVIERLGIMVETAAPSGIALCHENEKGIYGDNAERCLDILESVKGIKCIFDPANFVQCGQDVNVAWDMLGDRVYYLHIKDALADGSVVPAGHGVGALKRVVGEFVKNGGNALTVEPHLTVFSGLSNLEREGEKSVVGKFQYPDADTAFDAACDAIKAILKG